MDKKSRLKEELRLTEMGRDFLENVELPKHTNSLPPKVNDKVEPYKKINTIPIPEEATVGDVMQAMFPNEKVIETDSACVFFGARMRFDKGLWNAPYKKEVDE